VVPIVRPYHNIEAPAGSEAIVASSSVVFQVADYGHITAQAIVAAGAPAGVSIALYGSLDGGATYFPTPLATLTDTTGANSWAHNVASCFTHIKAVANAFTGTGAKVKLVIFGRSL